MQIGCSYDGLHGIAHALDRLELTAEASQVLDRMVALDLTELSNDLFAGIGLTDLHFADRFDTPARARQIGAILADRLSTRERVTLDALGTRSSSVGRGDLPGTRPRIVRPRREGRFPPAQRGPAFDAGGTPFNEALWSTRWARALAFR
jgi:hypothetical protein